MKIKFSFLLTAAFAVVLFSIPVLAHHSFAAQYDRKRCFRDRLNLFLGAVQLICLYVSAW